MPVPDDIREMLSRHGLRYTRQREQIYRAVASTRAHPTAEDVLGAVRDLDPGLSLATVYNALDAMTQCGLIRKVAGSSPCRYDADMSEHLHIRLGDGRVVDVPEDLSERLRDRLPPDMLAEIERRTGVRIERVRIEIDGRPA